ncbi:armadillo-type protein [Mycena amicta]|nr:armadillo-type protein [Mycena amicta]
MPPLSRQQTRESILSWWSDRNPPGATINLHALAKPLMGRMYDRQVLGFIKRTRGTPLSEETLQLCWNYLAYKHLLSITKKAILSELSDRARSVNEAQNLVDSVVFRGLSELLESPESKVREWTCWTVGRIAMHKSTSMAVLGLNPCPQLVSLLQDQSVEVIEAAMYALSWIVSWQEGAEAASAAKALDHVMEQLQHPSSEVRKWTCWAVGKIAGHKSTSMAVLELNPCPQLVGLLRHQPVEVIEAAMYALSWIVSWQGAEDASAAKALDHVMELLQNPASEVRRWTCWTVGEFTRHKSTFMAVLELNPCPQLVGLLWDRSVEVIEAAMYALSWIVSWQEGAEAASAAKALDHVMELLQHPSSEVRKWTCWAVGKIAGHKSTSMAVLELNPCPQLVSLLRDQPVEVTEAAVYALSRIVFWQEGAKSAGAAKALDYVMELLQAPASEDRKWTCWTVGEFARHRSISMAVLELNPCPQLVSLLQDQPVEVIEAAMYALSQIVFWHEGAQAASAAKALDHVMELLQHPASEVWRWTCWTVGTFAMHEATSMAVLGLNPCPQLVGLLRGQPVEVIEAAMYALSWIVSWQQGAEAASAAKALDHVMELLQHPASEVRGWTCWTVGRIVMHKSISIAVLELNPCPQLVSLLRDQPIQVIEAAMYALTQLVFWQEGAKSAGAAKALDHVMELLQAPASEVRKWTCWTVGNIAAHNSTSMAVLEVNPCPQLVSLLQDQPIEVTEAAMFALSRIVFWQKGAQPASTVKALHHIMELLQAPALGVQRWTCCTLGVFAMHQSTSMAVLELNPCPQLVSLLRDQPVDVIEAAMYALSQIVSWQQGAEAASAAKALDHVMELLQHPASEVRRWTCWTVGRIAAHKSRSITVLELNLCPQLIGLLHDHSAEVIEAATYALSQIEAHFEEEFLGSRNQRDTSWDGRVQ